MGIIILDPVSKTGPQSDIYQSGLSSILIRILPNYFKIGAFSFFFTKNRRGRNYLKWFWIFSPNNVGFIQRKKDNAIDSISYQFYRCIYLFKCQVLISFTRNTSQGIFSLSSRNKHYLLYKYKIIGLFQYNSSRYSSVKIEIFSPKWRFLFSLTV